MRKLLNRIRNLVMFKMRYPWVKYGEDVHVQWSARFWSPHKSVRLGDHVGIGRWCDISTDLVIGNHVLVAGSTAFLSRDAHSAYSPGQTMFEAPRGDRFGIVIEDDVWIGWGAIILSGVTVGRGSIIAAGSIVTKDVPRYSIVTSRPSQVLKQRFSLEEIELHEAELRRKDIIHDVDAPPLVLPTELNMNMSTILEERKGRGEPDLTASVTSGTGDRRLRCVVVSCVFPPEFTFSATTSSSIAEELVARGHEVTVLAPFPNKPAGKLFPGYRRGMYSSRKMPRGYKLVHCFGVLAPKSRMFSRLLENISFGLTAGLRLLFGKRPDVIYSNAWPVFATWVIVKVAQLRGVPVVVSVQDVYPESLVSQGRAGAQSLTFRVMQYIDASIARSAEALIVISDRFREIYRATRAVPVEKIHVVHNWGDRNSITVNRAGSAHYREAKGIPENALLAVYAGNIGPAAGSETLVEAFERLGDLSNAYLLIAGSGSNLTSCMARAQASGLERVVFHSPWQYEETDLVLGAADLFLLPTVGSQSLASVPSKLISYLLAGKPVLAMVMPQSDTASIVGRAQAGWTVPPNNPDALAAEIRKIASLPAGTLHSMGKSGKVFAHENLCRESNLPKLIRILEAAGRDQCPVGRAVAAAGSR